MTASELKYHIEQRGEEPYFFSRQTMRFFGDTMSNFGVRSVTVRVFDHQVQTTRSVLAWELYRKHPVKHGLQSSHYFRKDGYDKITDYTIVK